MTIRDAMMESSKREIHEVETSAGTAYFMAPTELHRVRFLQMCSEHSDDTDKSKPEWFKYSFGAERAWYVCWLVCDKDGDREFRDGDIDSLLQTDGKLINEIYTEIDRLYGSQDVEGTAKNLPETNGDASQSDLLTNSAA